MFKSERFVVWTWRNPHPTSAIELAVLTPDLSDASEYALKLFLERGYIVPSKYGLFEHPLRFGIPGALVECRSSRKEVEKFLAGLNMYPGDWDFRSIRQIEYSLDDLKTPLYLAYLREIERSISRRGLYEDLVRKLGF